MGLRDDIFMPFGKHKGSAVSETPSSYLRWCLEGDGWFERKYENLVEVFEEELNWRTDYGQHFEDPEDIRY